MAKFLILLPLWNLLWEFTFFTNFCNFDKVSLDKKKLLCYSKYRSAGVAHLVERHLAKVEVASSSLVARSISSFVKRQKIFFIIEVKKDTIYIKKYAIIFAS